MFLIRLFRFLSGYVLFSAAGGFPERFINLCTARHIAVWDIRPCGDTLYGKVRAGDYLRLHTVSRRSGMRLRIRRKCGLPFFAARHRAHFGLLIGAAVFLCVFALLSTRIWVIRFDDLQGIAEQDVRTALAEIGIREGMCTRALDASRAEDALPLKVKQLQWVALNRQGSVLHVTLRAELRPQGTADSTAPCHIVAAKDGVLVTLEPYVGKAMVRVPTAVQKGQLLISGVTDNRDGSVCLHHAKGYAAAQTTRTLTAHGSKTQTLPTVSRAQKRIALHLFSHTFPRRTPAPADGAQCFVYERFLTAGGDRLPIGCTVYRRLFFDRTRTLTVQETRLLALSDLHAEAAQTLQFCRILSQEFCITQDGGATTVQAHYRLLENIAREQEILLEEE